MKPCKQKFDVASSTQTIITPAASTETVVKPASDKHVGRKPAAPAPTREI